jgi:hypothetical protein
MAGTISGTNLREDLEEALLDGETQGDGPAWEYLMDWLEAIVRAYSERAVAAEREKIATRLEGRAVNVINGVRPSAAKQYTLEALRELADEGTLDRQIAAYLWAADMVRNVEY